MSSDEEELKNGHEVDDVEDSQSSEGSLEDEEEAVNEDEKDSFEELGLSEPLCEACERVGWKAPTKVQIAAIPPALSGKDVIALAETGSGKTGAFALPILQNLMQNPQRNYALILSPTRELAIQIAEHFSALGTCIGLSVAVIVGGVDMATQAISLAKRPHVIVATPGRLVDHLENTKGFHLRSLKYLVMDEADRILNMDFEAELEKILKAVSKLERASLKDPVKVEISSSKYQTVDRLKQYYVFIPLKYKEAYLVHILNEKAGNSVIIFCATCASVMKTAFMLRHLGFTSIALHGQMNQPARIGLDIANVDVVINYDVPTNSKDYVHRVGRTARAGKSGTSITIITQYDVEVYQSVESNLGTKLPEYPIRNEDVMPLVEHVSQAIRFASQKYKETNESSGKRSARGGDKEQKGRKSRRH
ncbi:RNA helicase [Aphelenchoides besseyi]|nr:RNA helicase [Aphelenchoides besseyi]